MRHRDLLHLIHVPESRLSEVVPGVFELALPIPFENGWVNSFLLRGEGHVDLIDCGMNSPDSVELLRGALEEVGGRGAGVRRLVVTHIHPDHYGAAGLLTKDGAELYLHRLEVPMVSPRYVDIDALVADVGRHLELHGVPEADAEEMRNASRAMRDFVTPASVAVQLDGAETLDVGPRPLRVEWTPGHSPGHVCLWDAEERVLFAGDQLLPEMSPNIGLHPQSTPNPLDEYLAALDHLLELEPRLVLPAHGQPFADAAQRVAAMHAHHSRRKDQIEEIVAGETMTGWEVSIAVFGRRQHLYERRLALQEALAHLQSLAVEGRVEKLTAATAVSWRRPR